MVSKLGPIPIFYHPKIDMNSICIIKPYKTEHRSQKGALSSDSEEMT